MIKNYKPDYLKLIFNFSLIYAFLFLVFRTLLVFSYTPDLGGVESNVIYTVCKMLNGLRLYGDPEDLNFDITQYSPIYYYLHSGLCSLFSLKPLTDLHKIYILGRSLSLFFNLVGSAVIYHILYRLFAVSKRISFIAALIQFTYLTKLHFSSRPDGLFSLVYIAFLFLMIHYFKEERKNKKEVYLYLACILAVISIFIKQNGIQLPILIAAYFIIYGGGRSAIKPVIVMTSVFSFIFFIFHDTYGSFFLKNIVGGLDNGISLARMYDVFSNFHLHGMLIFAAGIFLCHWIFKKDAKQFYSEY